MIRADADFNERGEVRQLLEPAVPAHPVDGLRLSGERCVDARKFLRAHPISNFLGVKR